MISLPSDFPWQVDGGMGQYVKPYNNPYGGLTISEIQKHMEEIAREREKEEAARKAWQQEINFKHSEWVLKWVEHILGPGMSVLFRIDKETAVAKWKEAGLVLEPTTSDYGRVNYQAVQIGKPMELMRFNDQVIAFFNWANGMCSVPVQPFTVDVV